MIERRTEDTGLQRARRNAKIGRLGDAFKRSVAAFSLTFLLVVV